MLSPDTRYPIEKVTKAVVFLKNFISNPNIQIGDYTYYDGRDRAESFESENVIFARSCKLIIFDLHDSLKNLKMPTLIIHGDTDPIPFSTASSIHKSIPSSRYVLMKNCGHFPYVEKPGEYFELLENFLCD